MANRYAVIMAGGKGERFWPASRLSRPKHLLPIVGDTPMLEQTIERLGDLLPKENILVITNSEQLEKAREVCAMLPAANVVAEPVGRDTAAAVGLAMLLVKARDPEACLAMLPADAYIEDGASFRKTLDKAFKAAEGHAALVTIGIQPTEPATGYGYIEVGEAVDSIEGSEVCKVQQFKEKPDLETAKRYLQNGGFNWNAGMFVWRASTIEAALEKLTPALSKGLKEIEDGLSQGRDLEELLAKLYPNLEKISVDFAVMEKADNVLTLAAEFDWDDVGAWTALERHLPKDSAGNARRGLVRTLDSARNIVVTSDDHLLALIGVDDLIAVRTGDATLICRKERAQEIKQLVKELGAEEALKRLV